MTTIATGNRRLLALVERLRGLPRQRFDYNVWVGDDWHGAADLSCGTTACALGWATTVPSIRRAGLRLMLVQQPFPGGTIRLIRNGKPVVSSGPEWNAPFEAAEDVFALTPDESADLFSGGKGTAKQVAIKIERFVARRS